MATNFSIRQKKESDEDSIDGDIEIRKNNQLNVKTNDAIRRCSIYLIFYQFNYIDCVI